LVKKNQYPETQATNNLFEKHKGFAHGNKVGVGRDINQILEAHCVAWASKRDRWKSSGTPVHCE